MINWNLKWLDYIEKIIGISLVISGVRKYTAIYNGIIFKRRGSFLFRRLDRDDLFFRCFVPTARAESLGGAKGENKFVARSWDQAAFQCNKPGRRWGSFSSGKNWFSSLSVYHQRSYRVLPKKYVPPLTNKGITRRMNEERRMNSCYIFIY